MVTSLQTRDPSGIEVAGSHGIMRVFEPTRTVDIEPHFSHKRESERITSFVREGAI
jgi:hypothetical protein